MRRITIVGMAVAALYLAVAWGTFDGFRVPVRPLFDGVHQQAPYRWVSPPKQAAATNTAPLPGEVEVPLKGRGSVQATPSTADQQAFASLPARLFEPRDGESSVTVRLTPLDPAALEIPPPAGLEFQGNAYDLAAAYTRSNEPAVVRDVEGTCDELLAVQPYPCATVFIQTPFGATGLYKLDGTSWTLVGDGESSTGIYGDVKELGVFVGLAEEGRIARSLGVKSRWGDLIAIGLAVVAMVGAATMYRLRSRARAEEAKKRAMGKKYRPPQKGERPPRKK